MIFNLVNRIATEDGQTHNTLEAARIHELTAFFAKTDTRAGDKPDGLAACIVQEWPRILEIMTSEPGESKPKAKPKRTLSKEQYAAACGVVPSEIARVGYALARRRVEQLNWSVADAVSNPPRERKRKAAATSPKLAADLNTLMAAPVGTPVEASTKYKGK
jgi:hypothetical protein